MEQVKGLLDHVTCQYNDLDCEDMHLDFVFCVHNACALGKKSTHGKAEARAHTAVLANG